MKFNDRGIIISIKKYGENSAIVKVFSQQHGIYRAFVKSVNSSKSRIIFQSGNLISFEYRSRLEDNLGQFFSCDLEKSYCNEIIFEPSKLHCVNSLFSIVEHCFLEHEEHLDLFCKLESFLKTLHQSNQPKNFISAYIKLELEILNSLGYGIDLSCCAVTNSTTDLAFVSPKSGRAVCFEIGKSYANKLLKLPNFLLEDNEEFSNEELFHGLELSGYFLQKFAFENNSSRFDSRKRLRNLLLEKQFS